MLVDSHAHINMGVFDEDRDAVIKKAFDAGIIGILCPTDLSEPGNLNTTLAIIQSYPYICAVAGVHPHNAKDFSSEHTTLIKDLYHENLIYAIGEIGLDFHYNFTSPDIQIEIFRQQLQLAQEMQIPVVIHSRLAERDIIEAIEHVQYTQGGVLHCFTESWNFAQKMLEKNFFISFSGIITFPKAHSLRETAKQVPLEKIMIETDSPYLAPVPFRGKVKRNEPIYIKETAKFLAELKDVPLKVLEETTTNNFQSCFGFDIKVF